MKKYIIYLFVLSLAGGNYAFGNATAYSFDTIKAIEPQDTIDWLVEQADEDTIDHARVIQKVDENGDTTFITLGKRRIRIVDKDDDTSLKIEKMDEEFDFHSGDDWESKGWKDFKGHWAGFEFGLNNYVDRNNSLSRTPENEFMDINTGKSWNFNLNFAQYSLGFGSDRVGAVIGMGIEWNNYHFSNQNSIEKFDGEIESRDIPDGTYKNRFQTTYLTLPLLIEYQFRGKKRNDRVYIGGGIIGGMKIFSNTKVKYTEDGSKRKAKDKSDYYLSPLRYGLTLRAGYKIVKLFANYYPTPLFIEGRGPELHPVAAGLVISF